MRLVDGRASVVLLLETAAAVVRLHEILAVAGIDEVIVGLNDLHLSSCVSNPFELVASDMMTMISDVVRARGLRFGFGGLRARRRRAPSSAVGPRARATCAALLGLVVAFALVLRRGSGVD